MTQMIISIVAMMIMVVAILLPMFYFTGKLKQIFQQKYPDLYEKYKNDFSGTRRNPYSILIDKQVKELNDLEVNGILRLMKILVVVQVISVYVLFYFVARQMLSF